MIKLFGFNTLAFMSWGLGIRVPVFQQQLFTKRKPKVEFVNIPAGSDIEIKSNRIYYKEGETEFIEGDTEFKDK